MEVGHDDHREHINDTVAKHDNGEGQGEGHGIVEHIQGNNNTNHKTFSIDDILRQRR